MSLRRRPSVEELGDLLPGEAADAGGVQHDHLSALGGVAGVPDRCEGRRNVLIVDRLVTKQTAAIAS
jgi:hypothetical protein